jgi:hypothetical protein
MQEVHGMNPNEMTSRKPRKPRSDHGPRLTERDHKALSWIGQQYAVRLDQLQILLARLGEPGDSARKPKEKGRLTQKRTMDLVRRWEWLGLVSYGWFLHADPAWVWLSAEGLRAVRQQIGDLRHFEPTVAGLSHLFFCNQARLLVEERYPDGLWQSERQLRAGRKPGERPPHLPDGLLTLPNGHVVAIEIERSVTDAGRLREILQALTSQYQMVWYFCTGDSEKVIKKAVETLPESSRRKILITSSF